MAHCKLACKGANEVLTRPLHEQAAGQGPRGLRMKGRIAGVRSTEQSGGIIKQKA